MTRQEIANKVLYTVREQLMIDKKDTIYESTTFEELGADSLDLVELTMALEEAFDTEIDDEEAQKITTSKEVVDWLEERLG